MCFPKLNHQEIHIHRVQAPIQNTWNLKCPINIQGERLIKRNIIRYFFPSILLFNFNKTHTKACSLLKGVVQVMVTKQAVLLYPNNIVSCLLCGFFSSDEVNLLLCIQLKNCSVFKFSHATRIELPVKKKPGSHITKSSWRCYSVELLDYRMPAWKLTSVSLLHQGLQSKPLLRYSTLLSRRLIKLITGLWAFQPRQGKPQRANAPS